MDCFPGGSWRRRRSHLSISSLFGWNDSRESSKVQAEEPRNPPNSPNVPIYQPPPPLLYVSDDGFAKEEIARANRSERARRLANSAKMSNPNSTPSFLDPRSALDSSRKTKQKAEAVKIAKQQENAVHEKLKRNGLPIPKYEFLELIGKGAYGRVFKRYEFSSPCFVS